MLRIAFPALLCVLFLAAWASGQESEPPPSEAPNPAANGEAIRNEVDEFASDARRHVDNIARQVDADERAEEVKAGILKPIYLLAERLAFPAFHWAAFAMMATGVVSYALQLVFGKLAVLSKMSLSPAEILSDALGLSISAVGLVLTTQAAAENSTFTQSPFSVISASATGVLAGFVFYRWGQRQELQAVAGRQRTTPKSP
ncbi:MAG: hypothetical protein KF774_02360 [Planctomyces sp.]|nr:hypothetical protein [Planctomyces sp.]